MFSKLRLLFLTLLLAITCVLSCTPKVGEAPPAVTSPKMESLNCLVDLKPLVSQFLMGEAKDQEVSNLWDCSRKAVQGFQQYVYGRNEDRFEPDELATFLENEFLAPGTPKISPALQQEAMQLKRLFIGGSELYLTRAELAQLDEILQKFKSMSLKLNPYMKVLVKAWDPKELHFKTANRIQHFENASQAVESVSSDLAGLITSHQQAYPLERLSPLVRNFTNFSQQDRTLSEVVDRYIPVLMKLKKAIVGGDEAEVGPTEWQSFIKASAAGYLQYLRYYYFAKDRMTFHDV